VERRPGEPVLEEAMAGRGTLGLLQTQLEALPNDKTDRAKADEMNRILAAFGEVQGE
jgi:hypothetical protein